jgi:hypothetical protein
VQGWRAGGGGGGRREEERGQGAEPKGGGWVGGWLGGRSERGEFDAHTHTHTHTHAESDRVGSGQSGGDATDLALFVHQFCQIVHTHLTARHAQHTTPQHDTQSRQDTRSVRQTEEEEEGKCQSKERRRGGRHLRLVMPSRKQMASRMLLFPEPFRPVMALNDGSLHSPPGHSTAQHTARQKQPRSLWFVQSGDVFVNEIQ